MTDNVDPIELARMRIKDAFDPQIFGLAGADVVTRLAKYMADAQQSAGDVLNWQLPEANVELAGEILNGKTSACTSGENEISQPQQVIDHVADLVQTIVTHGHTLHDPRYIGHQVPPPLPIASLFDWVSSTTNQPMAIYEMGPWATAVERVMVKTLGEALGFQPDAFSGLLTSGGSLANLTALLTARNVALPDVWQNGVGSGALSPVIIGHAESHYSAVRAAGILGLGADQFLPAQLDEIGAIDPIQLDEQLAKLREQGRPIVAVIACACSTRLGVFDPLADIAQVCQRHDVWLHVDAAHGGAACLSERHRHRLKGIEQADSVVWDAHKMLFMPALCAFVFYRDKSYRMKAFDQDAPYLFDPAAPELAEYDSGLQTVECTKRAMAFGLWGAWSVFGQQLFADMVDVTFERARAFYDLLNEADDFEPVQQPQANIVVFRYCPQVMREWPASEAGEFQWRLRRRLIESGEYYIVPGKDQGTGALRAVVMNPLTQLSHLKGLLAALRKHGQAMLNEK